MRATHKMTLNGTNVSFDVHLNTDGEIHYITEWHRTTLVMEYIPPRLSTRSKANFEKYGWEFTRLRVRRQA